MARGRVLIADADGLTEGAAAHLSTITGAPEVTRVEDGARCVSAVVKLVREQQPARLVVIADPLPRLGAASLALALRAIERGLGAVPHALLIYSPSPADEETRTLIARIGRAVHLQRPADAPFEEQSRRLGVAIERLLAQLGGA